MSSRARRTIYVGNLPGDIRVWEIEDLFHKYGPMVDVDLRVPPRPPGYCFIEFEDARDAEDAIRGRDGYNFDGHCLRVELAHGGRGQSSFNDRHSSHGSASGGRSGVSKRSEFRVIVDGLPSSASWKLDDCEFKNPFARSYIRVKSYEAKSRSRNRSPINSRSRSVLILFVTPICLASILYELRNSFFMHINLRLLFLFNV